MVGAPQYRHGVQAIDASCRRSSVGWASVGSVVIKVKKRTPIATRWECGFSTKSIHSVDETVDKLWKQRIGGRVPFGDLRNQFRRHHCRTLNPYGSDTCPYAREACVQAFLDTVRKTVAANPKVPVGYFIRVARTTAAIRADEKPLARDRSTNGLTGNQPAARVRTDVSIEASEEVREGRLGQSVQTSSTEGQRMRRTTAGPVGIGDVFRSLDLRPRQSSSDEGKESAE